MGKQIEIYPKIFTWLFIGLITTFISGATLAMNPVLLVQILSFGILPIVIIELVIAIVLSARIVKMKPLTAKICYLLYSFITGITFSTIFIVYELSSLISIFLITSIIFAVLAIYGYKTKRDLSNFGTILIVSLLITLIISILNYFIFKNAVTDIIMNIIGVIIFCGFIAYDMSKIKNMLPIIGEEKTAVYGAFQLYLDFINLLIRLLELFGKKRDN